LFFSYLSFFVLNEVVSQLWFFLIIMLVGGSLYIASLLFDVNFIKSFFAYSTVINSTFFMLILVSSFA
jgi:hypothetical protein